MEQVTKQLVTLNAQQNQIQPTNILNQIPIPQPLEVNEGDLAENFKFFKDNWENYCIASGMDQWRDAEARKVSILITIIGNAAMRKFLNFQLTEEQKATTASVLEAIEAKIVVKKNLIYERFLFHCCNQSPDETFDDYLIKLKKLVKSCGFAEMSDELLRDRIVFGLSDLVLKKKLLDDEPTLEKTIDSCKISETRNVQFKRMTISDSTDRTVQKVTQTEKVNARSQEDKRKSKKPCNFCAGFHKWKKELCPAYGKKCTVCKELNHNEECCSKNRSSDKKSAKQNIRVKEVVVRGNSSDEDSDFNDLQIGLVRKVAIGKSIGKQKRGPRRVELKLFCDNKWKDISSELDSGADCCLMGYKFYCKLMKVDIPKLEPPKYRLQAINGTAIPCKGQTIINCQEKDKIWPINFFIVEVEHGPLLSEEVCVALGLLSYSNRVSKVPESPQRNIKKSSVCEINREGAEEIINQYKHVFQGYGNLPGEVHLEIDENIPPVIQPARRVPMAFRSSLKEELSKLEKDGIITKEQSHTDWVSNIVCVKKGESFRICLDPIPLLTPCHKDVCYIL